MQTEWMFQKSGVEDCTISLLSPLWGILVIDALKSKK
jgi:hypothetical protein